MSSPPTFAVAPNNYPPRLLRVGILGCASIAYKLAKAISHPASGCCVTAIASRSAEKAQALKLFILKGIEQQQQQQQQQQQNKTSTTPPAPFEITILAGPDAYHSLIASSDLVDALYIPLPTSLHRDFVVPALQAQKHVLLEKPMAESNMQLQDMIAAARQHGVYLQDGTMFVHHPRTWQFLRALGHEDDDHHHGGVGQVNHIEVGFTFCADDQFLTDNIRVKKDGDPLGCVGDLGWYVVRMALMIWDTVASKHPTDEQGTALPTSTTTSATKTTVVTQVVDYKVNQDGVPIDATCFLKFADKISVSFHVGFQTAFRQYIHVVGTKACAYMDDFVLPKHFSQVNYQIESMALTPYDILTEHDCKTVPTYPRSSSSSIGDKVDTDPNLPVQEVLMWQTFSKYAHTMDQVTRERARNNNRNNSPGSSWDADECRSARELLHMTERNQIILDALMTSIRSGGSKVEITC